MKTITVFSKENCPYCTEAKRLLKNNNITFEEVSLSKAEERELFVSRYPNLKTMPQIFVGKDLIPGGYNGLKAYVDIAINEGIDPLGLFST